MKTMKKVLSSLFVAISTFAIAPQTMVMAATTDDVSKAMDSVKNATKTNSTLTGSLADTVGSLLGFLQVASGFAAVLMIAVLGFNYIISAPDVKEEMKKKMFPIIIGLVLVFSAVSIAKFILGVVG